MYCSRCEDQSLREYWYKVIPANNAHSINFNRTWIGDMFAFPVSATSSLLKTDVADNKNIYTNIKLSRISILVWCLYFRLRNQYVSVYNIAISSVRSWDIYLYNLSRVAQPIKQLTMYTRWNNVIHWRWVDVGYSLNMKVF